MSASAAAATATAAAAQAARLHAANEHLREHLQAALSDLDLAHAQLRVLHGLQRQLQGATPGAADLVAAAVEEERVLQGARDARVLHLLRAKVCACVCVLWEGGLHHRNERCHRTHPPCRRDPAAGRDDPGLRGAPRRVAGRGGAADGAAEGRAAARRRQPAQGAGAG